ncbi:MAG: phosphoserine transaminase, partial [Alphaproteobacteria bacterium]|nr:phosphoserine transaminase [Alphaproteobacteria bacterium]
MKPTVRPANPCFSSGPCAKRPGWSPAALSQALVGRSHRSASGLAQCAEVIERSRTVLQIPADYKIAIVPGSDTGAVEMALWSLLGPRGVDLLSWENFSETWVDDVVNHLKLPDIRRFHAPYGKLSDLSAVDPDRDIVFVWNGTTSGVRVPHGDWIADSRKGLTICDATSAAFAMRLPWAKLDVVTWSWQKALGGEAAHGMIALSPRAVERLESYTPPWPLPKVFRMIANGRLIEGLFRGETINTPSMLCVEDAIDLLKWAEAIGGLAALTARAEGNLAAVAGWVERSPWARFLAADPRIRSCTSICLEIADPWFAALSPESRFAV